jgi:ABC-type branched-subunit amino acid transport system substrate-binding protein
VPIRSRALAGSGVACLAALAIAGCSAAGTSSGSSSSSVTISGNTLSIYLSEPSDLGSNVVAQDIVHAEQMAFAARRGEVKGYKLVLETVRAKTLTDNARTAIIDSSTIAYLGELAPGASDDTVGITNALDVLQVSPTDNALELSDSTPAVSGGPKSYFESWSTYGRTFARVVPSGAEEAKALVAEMKSSGVTRLDVTNDGSDYGKAIAYAVRSDAKAAGLTLDNNVGEAVNGYFDGTDSPAAAAKFFNHIASMSPKAKLFGPSSLNSSAFTSALSGSVRHLYVSIPGFLPKDLPAAGRSFLAAFKARYGHAPNVEAIFGYEAMSALLHVLASEGVKANNRTDVVAAFLKQHNVQSVLGTYAINNAGNTSLDAFVFARISGGKLVPFAAAPQS